MRLHLRRTRWLAYGYFPGALLLRYHRVTDLEADPNGLAVSPRLFAAQMEVLRRRFRPVPLSMLTEPGRGRLPVRGVVVTFDDGYADNLLEAAPVLERYEIPATVFVTTGLLDQDGEFWWDTLDRILLQPGELPARLHLVINGEPMEFDLGSDARHSERSHRAHRDWTLRTPDHPTRRHELFRILSERLRPLADASRRTTIADLGRWAGVRATPRAAYRTLSHGEVEKLSSGGLIAIGSHSVTHPMLSRLDQQTRWQEISESRRELERLTGRAVTVFAYPYGVAGRSEAMVREAGYLAACGTRAGIVFGRGARYRLPRVRADNWDAGEFESRLATLP